jgi:hypothetical protein
VSAEHAGTDREGVPSGPVDIASLTVATIALVLSIFSTAYARRSARSSDKAAIAADATAVLDGQRRHEELTPRFKISCTAAGVDNRKLEIKLLGPAALGRLDGLTVTIRDDNPWLAEATPLASGPSREEIKKQIWGPYRFTPGTGQGADPVRGIPGADRDGRSTPTGGLPVGESLPFFLEPVTKPHWTSPSTTREDWLRDHGTVLRLALACTKNGYEPWSLVAELETSVDSSTEAS